MAVLKSLMMCDVFSSRTDLQDQPLKEAEWILYANGSSDMDKGDRKVRYAVMTLECIAEVEPLPLGTSTQKAELIALMRALELSHTKKVYTDSKYAFRILYAHGLIWKERGLLTTNKKEIKHAAEISKLLEAI